MLTRVLMLLDFFVFYSSYASSQENDALLFQSFKDNYKIQYESLEDEGLKFLNFQKNLREIENHNLNGVSSYKLGINQFSDKTHEEFKAIKFGYVRPRSHSSRNLLRDYHKSEYQYNTISNNLPKSIDWRDKGAITKVKNQGICGSCWAHAATENIESYLQINTGSLIELSVQQITDCTPNENHCGGTGGCAGSVSQLAFVYTQLYGINTEEDYPYTSGNSTISEKCQFDAKKAPAKVTLRGYEILPRNNQTAFLAHLAYKGPLAISVAADTLRSYSFGIFDGCLFNTDDGMVLNHEIQLIGYGVDEVHGDYWIARNSWGPGWGENGYIRFKRTNEPNCGLDKKPLDGSGCSNDGIDDLLVCGECGLLFEGVYPIGVKFTD